MTQYAGEFLHPDHAREILPGGRYKLFGHDCPTEVMAAYEHIWAMRHSKRFNSGMADLMVAWTVQVSLMEGDFELAMKLRSALEALGWQPTG